MYIYIFLNKENIYTCTYIGSCVSVIICVLERKKIMWVSACILSLVLNGVFSECLCVCMGKESGARSNLHIHEFL